jgi:UDP-N-acetylglucosamine 4,6-dehydratase
MALDLNHKSILITGGTGSFGRMLVESIFRNFPEVGRVVVYSRDEYKQFEMSQQFSGAPYRALKYMIGDVRDAARLTRCCEGIDVIVHAAALKQVPAAELNPMECIKTNIFGAENVVNAALDSGVKSVVALSTDKAAAATNLYGATKLCSDKLFVAANNMRGNRDIRLSVVRYGNVIGSRGSVVPFFLKKLKEGVLPVTHPEMTRFNTLVSEGIELVYYALENAWGGEIFVPKISSYRLQDMANAIGPDCWHEIIGIRPGEKMHEEMITEDDASNTVELEKYYVILPAIREWSTEEYMREFNGKRVPEGFRYSSGNNSKMLTVEDIRLQVNQFLAEHPQGGA